MKQTTLLIAMALLCAVAVSAMQISAPTIIGAKGASASANFTIYNDGPSTLNYFQITSTAEPKYQISFQNIPSTLAPGQTSTVTIQGFVPVELVALQLIGNMNVNAYGNSFPNQDFYNKSNLPCGPGSAGCGGIYGNSAGTAPINMQPSGTTPTPTPTPTPTSNTSNTSSILKIDKVRLVCDKTKTVSDGSSIEASAGQKCTLTVKIENTGSKDLEDIEIDVDADGDIDADSADISKLSDGDEKEVTIAFEIDKDAEGDNDVTVTAEGEDEDGKSHKDSMSFTVEIKKPKHSLEIDRFTISPSTISSCNAGTVEVRVSVDNLGREDEDSASVELSITGLSFTKKEDVEVQEGDSETVSFTVPVSKAGSFTATARVFYDNIETDSDTQTFTVEKCVEAVKPAPQVKPEPPRSALPQNDIIVVPPKVEASFYDSTAFTVLLFVGNIVALSAIGILAYNFFFKKKPDSLGEQFNDDKSYEELINPKDYY